MPLKYRQTTTATTQYLLYDGLGSTRQLLNSDETTIDDSYSYDAYGVMLGTDDTAAENADTSLLYAGEHYDSELDQYYLRARYYNPWSGTFNRTDPFAGNNQDPQSLHKYAYCHNNPINAIDPSGKMFFSITSLAISMAIGNTLQTLYSMAVWKAATRAMEWYLGARTNFNIRNQPKVESNATIFVHGISGHSYGWSSGFEASLNARASNQDYYEFTWSGFAATGGVGINSIAGDIATDSLVDAIGAIRQKGYRNINIVAHSWGTVLSRDAQNEEGGAINTWVTMGSPLSASTNKPAGVGYWLNMWARYDWFAHELGSLYKNPGVDEQFRVDDVVEEYSLKNHSAYWTDMRALDKIGNQISGQ